MKTLKTLFALLFISSMFVACESDSVNEEVGLEQELEVFGINEDEEEDTNPDNAIQEIEIILLEEDEEEDTNPVSGH